MAAQHRPTVGVLADVRHFRRLARVLGWGDPQRVLEQRRVRLGSLAWCGVMVGCVGVFALDRGWLDHFRRPPARENRTRTGDGDPGSSCRRVLLTGAAYRREIPQSLGFA